ncbi:right-handed parallel beta-helix repeat-containing protein [Streptomyces virginiae]|uniref:right-handed parallel beta-helix repeat-containing protein n=1 Tax=Streptomyces virginiae TaxID=1961 RepID=UPI00225162FC|nr:right-handed parallel beta-helix repeat-containing protein [Streptomyces virginiae]MCX5275659.1 right-handed parallel beta-helix repeat-containing protein [Streptomyces virginiae]
MHGSHTESIGEWWGSDWYETMVRRAVDRAANDGSLPAVLPSVFPDVEQFAEAAAGSIYAFNARKGTIEYNYASGSADSGIHVGQCKPCGILVRGDTAERNAVGYENTNPSGPLWIVGNRFTGNRGGMTIGSDYLEALTPQIGATIAGNLVADNTAAADTPEQADGGYGIGLGIAGGRDNTVTHNRITGHPRASLVLTSTEDLPPIGNRMTGNVFDANAFDAAYLASAHAAGSGNCFTGPVGRTVPADLAAAMECSGRTTPAPDSHTLPTTLPAPPGIPFLDAPLPPAQPQLPDAVTAPATPVAPPAPVDPADVTPPPPTLLADRSRDRPGSPPPVAGPATSPPRSRPTAGPSPSPAASTGAGTTATRSSAEMPHLPPESSCTGLPTASPANPSKPVWAARSSGPQPNTPTDPNRQTPSRRAGADVSKAVRLPRCRTRNCPADTVRSP